MKCIPTGGGGSCAMCIISDLPLSQAPNPPIHSVLFTVVQSRVSHFLESLKVLNKLKVLLAME